MIIGIIREEKQPADKRVAFNPQQCKKIQQLYPGTRMLIQPSPDRCFADSEYVNAGVELTDDLTSCDVLFGIKEVPPIHLIENKTYLFFSHTIKKQPHNRGLLRECLRKNIRLIDYELLTWENGSRILGFGRFAGIVGGHNTLLAWGGKSGHFILKPAWKLPDFDALINQYSGLSLPNVKIIITGDGRVSHGVIEMFDKIGIREVTPRAFLEDQFQEAVYVHLRSEHYYEHKEHRPWDKSQFYHSPEDYYSVFRPYYRKADILINGIFWKEGVPAFFSKEEMKEEAFRIRVIGDISCDIPGSIPCTLRSTTIESPVYGYHPYLEKETEPYLPHTIDVMAVGNLPCELPVDASSGFGDDLIRSVVPHFMETNNSDIITRAIICENGNLMPKYLYLTDYIS